MDDLLTTDACTLPTPDRPLRLAEFDDLFASAARGVTRSSDGTVEIRLTGSLGLRDQAADLAARESACCSFFTFTVVGQDDDVMLRISVPPERQSILDALADRAEGASA